ncbi:MAG: hypothetical protein A2176_00110 [Spirochaetes bacterium RBG_13_51_14]|nr:MAG: hypothetical protein A2176_00110 [Spirochaetes bacterium RBG_13_51_14]
MRLTNIAIITLMILAFAIAALPETTVEMGTRLMKMNDDQPIFQKVKGDAMLNIYGSTGVLKFQKKLVMATYTENMGTPSEKENYICYFLAPADDAGNAYLMYNFKALADIKYAYLKGIRKAKKVTGADKKLSFFGSDFTNGDLGKPDFTECNYNYLGDRQIIFKGKPFNCYMIESIPKTDEIMRDTGYGRKITYLEKKTLLTLLLEFYDENKIKAKELRLLRFTSLKNMKGQMVFYYTGYEMKNLKRGTKTELLFNNMKFEQEANISPNIFTVEYMTRKWW